MEWDTLEHSYTEKTNDWYASVIIISGSLIAVELLMNNWILIALIMVGTISFLLLAARRPNIMHVTITNKGVRAGNTLYPYSTLDGFAIAEYAHEERLLLESNRHIMPLHVIPIAGDINSDDVREALSHYLPEKDLQESLPHLIFERLGF